MNGEFVVILAKKGGIGEIYVFLFGLRIFTNIDFALYIIGADSF